MISGQSGSCDVEPASRGTHREPRREKCARSVARYADMALSGRYDRPFGPVQAGNGPLDAARRWSPGLFHSRKCASKPCIWGMSVQSRSRMEIGSDGCGSRGSLENSRRNEARGSWGGTTRGRCCLPSPYSLQGSGAGDRRSRVRRAFSSAGPDPGWPLRSPEPHHRHRSSGSIR
jgi:hypothetical protein